MPLKDLVVDADEHTESQIEQIVGSYLRYDLDGKGIVLMPEFGSLTNDKKILVYLTALKGWKFVTEDEVDISTAPSELEGALGIKGNSLRPKLKSLFDKRLIQKEGKQYNVPISSLSSIAAMIDDE